MDSNSAVRAGEMSEMMDSNSAVRAGEMSEMMGSSPVSDYQAAVEFAKTIDPATVAREGEAAAIAGANLPADQKQMLLNVLNGTGKMQEMMGTYQVDDGTMQMMPSQMTDMQLSGAITPDKMTYMIDGQPMEMATSTYDEAVRLGIITPDTVMENIDGMEIARPPMAPEQSLRPELRPEPMRPRMRPENLGG